MKKQLLTLGLTILFSTALFAQTWEEVSLTNGDFALPSDSIGYSGTALSSDTVPGWYYDGPEAKKVSRAYPTVKLPTGDVKEYMCVMGFDGNGNGGGTLYNIVDTELAADMQYKLSYNVRCSWLAKVDSAYAMAYISYLNDDFSRTKLDSTHFTLLPGKTTDADGKDMFYAKELIVDMAGHADAVGKKIVLEFAIANMAFSFGEMATPTKATWSQVDNVALAKSASVSDNIAGVSSIDAKFSVSQNQLTVDFPTSTKGRINIYNIGGALVFTDKVNASKYIKHLNLKKGIYIIKMDTQLGSKVVKFSMN